MSLSQTLDCLDFLRDLRRELLEKEADVRSRGDSDEWSFLALYLCGQAKALFMVIGKLNQFLEVTVEEE